MLSDEEIRFMYGQNAVISRKGRFTLVHLDHPSINLVRMRTEDFDPEEFFKCGCRICQISKDGGIVVFDDDTNYEDEEILLD